MAVGKVTAPGTPFVLLFGVTRGVTGKNIPMKKKENQSPLAYTFTCGTPSRPPLPDTVGHSDCAQGV